MVQSNKRQSERIYYMDAMRSILMSLGLVLHAANIFSIKPWAISHSESSVLFDMIVDSIHVFRMPAFFIISGFFCHMTLSRYGSVAFLRIRLPRIIIPFLSVAIIFNSFQSYILSKYNGQDLSYFDIIGSFSYWVSGDWVSHLWFLYCLIVYFLVAGLCCAFALNSVNKMGVYFSLLLDRCPSLYLFILTAISMAVSVLANKISVMSFGQYLVPEFVPEIVLSIPFFVFGVFLGSSNKWLDTFCLFNVKDFVVFFMAGVFVLLVKNNISVYEKFLLRYAQEYIVWVSCVLCFVVFKNNFNKPSKFFSYFSEASYSIYLFHHLFVVVFGLLLLNLSINLYVKFLCIVLISLISTLLLHHYGVLKFKVLRYIFNGK